MSQGDKYSEENHIKERVVFPRAEVLPEYLPRHLSKHPSIEEKKKMIPKLNKNIAYGDQSGNVFQQPTGQSSNPQPVGHDPRDNPLSSEIFTLQLRSKITAMK